MASCLRSTEGRRLHCPPALSDSESATQSRERREVAIVCGELAAQLTTECRAKLEEVRKDIDAKMAAQLTIVLDAVASIDNPAQSSTLQSSATSSRSAPCQVFGMAKTDLNFTEIEAKMEPSFAPRRVYRGASQQPSNGVSDGCLQQQ